MVTFEDYRSVLIPTMPFSRLKIGDYIGRAKKKKLFKGEFIQTVACNINDPYLYYVEEGQIAAMFERESGDSTAIFWRGAGNAFPAEYGHMASIGRYRARFYATENTVLFCFTQQQIYELTQENPELFYEFIFLCHMSFAQMGHRLSDSGSQTSMQRMIMWLQKLCSICKADANGVYAIECNMTLKQISELLFIHITTCTKIIALLENEGILKRSKTHICIYDLKRLPEFGLHDNHFSY